MVRDPQALVEQEPWIQGVQAQTQGEPWTLEAFWISQQSRQVPLQTGVVTVLGGDPPDC